MLNITSVGAMPTQSTPLGMTPFDIGFRCPIEQSSAFSAESKASALYPALSPGAYFFHTDMENSPWVVVDLEFIRTIGQIRVWNREDAGLPGIERAVPLIISASTDQITWVELVKWEGCFGGRLSGTPLAVSFSTGVKARYVKFHVPRQTHLHLDYIEIFQMIPKITFGDISGLTFASGTLRCDYNHSYNSGLYSICSTALHDIVILANHGIGVNRIDLTRSMRYFKDKHDEDVYKLFFERNLRDNSRLNTIGSSEDIKFHWSDVHQLYGNLPLSELQELALGIFKPSEAILDTASILREAYKLIPDKTIAIVYRGTDKGTELTLAPIEHYIDIASEIKQKKPDFKILIQTDQEQARDKVVQYFGSDCIFFDHLPVTTGDKPIHQVPEIHIHRGRTAFTTNLMAAILVLSQCETIILHTGNLAAWIAFYRGNSSGLYQFDSHGELAKPLASAESLTSNNY